MVGELDSVFFNATIIHLGQEPIDRRRKSEREKITKIDAVESGFLFTEGGRSPRDRK